MLDLRTILDLRAMNVGFKKMLDEKNRVPSGRRYTLP